MGENSEKPKYIPSGTSPQLVINSINDSLGHEIALPGTWSPTLFYTDLKEYPVKSKKILGELIYRANTDQALSYLEFFEKSRGVSRPESKENPSVWEAFSSGSVMLYFEPLFLKSVSKKELSRDDQVILMYIKELSKHPVPHWNAILENLGCCSYQFFGKEPELYVSLLYRTDTTSPKNMTDQDLIKELPDQTVTCRSELVELYEKRRVM